MPVIVIQECQEYPWFSNDAGGNKPHCNEPSLMSKKPYADQRVVNPLEVPAWCPISRYNEAADV